MSIEKQEAPAVRAAADQTLVWERRVACRTLEGTAFILQNSRMVSLNGTGTRIWELFEPGATVEAVAAQIAQEFEIAPESAREDCAEFVQALLARGLIVVKD